jgi:Na+/phosphate symporter
MEIPAAQQEIRPWWKRAHWYKVGLFVVSIFLFILAITMMKEGARELGPLIRGRFSIDNPVDSLGFGWLFAYVVMSGSPVAAAALAFFDAGVVDKLGAYTMITGSRLGASLIVLFIGFIYVLRGRDRATSLGMGLLSLVVTGTTHLLALPLGLAILSAGTLDHLQLSSGTALNSVTDLLFGPIVSGLLLILPEWSLFIIGFGVTMVSFSLFDRALPQMTLKESQVGQMSRLVYRPWVMFLFGAALTTLSMSVSISLSILDPLSARGFVRRENVVPYIMGANVTTFIDTVLAAVLLNNPQAFTVILVNMISITVISALILGLAYRSYESMSLAFVRWATRRKRNLGLFMFVIILVPIVLMLL